MTNNLTIRRLNELGISEFRAFISSGGGGAIPTGLLTDEVYSEPTSFSGLLDKDKVFKTRLDFAEYVWATLEEDWDASYEHDSGFWSWIALAYLNQFIGKDGKLREAHHYIFDPRYNVAHRHCAATPVNLVRDHGIDRARVFLSDKIESMGDMVEQCVSRQYMMRSPVLVDVIYKLYRDPESGKAKSGSASKPAKKKNKTGKWSKAGAGSIRRLAIEVRRLLLTYNVEAMSADEVIGLLGDEYDKFREYNDSRA